MDGYRVLMIAPTPFFTDRGCHVRIAEEATALQALGHRLTICTYHLGRDVPGLDVRRTPPVPWYRKTSAGPSIHKFYVDLMLMALTARVARAEKPDILHGHLHEGALIAGCVRGLCARRSGPPPPVVFDFQGSLTGELVSHKFVRRGGLPYRVLRWMEGRIDRSADAIIASSVQVADELREGFPLRPGAVEVVSDGVNAEAFRPMGCRDEMRQELGIPPTRKVIGYLGVLTEYQGTDCLLRSMPAVIAQVPEAHLLLLGWPNVERYRALAGSLGVSERVTFAGRVEYRLAPRYLAAADVAVAPKMTTTESNHKVHDYMACGLPSVVFDLPVNREILGNLGIYAKERSPEALAAALIASLADLEAGRELGARARELAVREYSWSHGARQITAVYDRLAKRVGGVEVLGC